MQSSFGRSGQLPQNSPRWWQSFGAFAFLAAILGVISVGLAPIVYVIGMISIIGIPFALIAVIFPTLCLWIVISYLVFRIRPLHSKFGIVRSFMIALLVMAVVPQAYNFRLMRAVATLQNGDITASLTPLQPDETLAVLRGSRSSLKCFNVCIDLLLSGQVSTYIAASMPRGSMEPGGEMNAMQHRLVKAQTCENPNVIPKNASTNEDDPRMVAYHLKAAKQRGICIQSTQIQLTDLGELRAIVDYGRKNLDYPKSLFFIDTKMNPSRLAVYEKSALQNWEKIMQQTNISYSRLGPLLVHSISGGMISSLQSGWWREIVRVRSLDLETFLVEKMGAELRPQ